MNISMKWLREYAPVDIIPHEYAEKMTMSGSKVESLQDLSSTCQNVVVGKIIKLERHPDADKLFVCGVDVGSGIKQIVTGADNLKIGDIIPVGLNGSILPCGKNIKSGKLRGVNSEGMLCSLSELNLDSSDYPNAVEDGIMVLEGDYPLGADIRPIIGLDDVIVEFEITSNRPDCNSVLGLARETAATLALPFTLPETAYTESGGDINDELSVSITAPDLCPRYMARMVKNVKIGPSPEYIRERLRACGVRPINNIVDITNYVMLESGQPMHAFDSRFLEGNEIIVRRADNSESIVTLDGVTHKLSDNNLVIADKNKPVAIAGVMGGEHSGILEDTATVIFESANFAGASVRNTARQFAMRTDASSRFEKGLDPGSCKWALDRACALIEELKCGEIVSGEIDIYPVKKDITKITLEASWINEFLGIDLTENEMKKILTAAGFTVDGTTVTVPENRRDVTHKADLAEEIARFYGYNKIPSQPLSGAAEATLTPAQKYKAALHSAVLGLGFSQIQTYSFISPKLYDKANIPVDSPVRNCVKISNPLGEDTSLMRTTALPSMFDILSKNYNNRNPEAALYEFATEYYPNQDEAALPDENVKIILGLYGKDADYFTLKGAVEELLISAGLPEYDIAPAEGRPEYHPGRCAVLRKGRDEFAVLGEIHPTVCESFGLPARVYTAELDFAKLMKYSRKEKLYKPLPKFPAAVRDLAFVCDEALPAAELLRGIKKAGGKLLESVELFDIYTGPGLGEGKKSLAYTITLRADDRTLTDAEAEQSVSKIVANLKNIGAELRGS